MYVAADFMPHQLAVDEAQGALRKVRSRDMGIKVRRVKPTHTQDAAALGGLGFPTPERWRVIQGPGGHRHPGCEAGFQEIATAQTLSLSGIAMLCVHGYTFPGWIDW
jgi:hypothetical protein